MIEKEIARRTALLAGNGYIASQFFDFFAKARPDQLLEFGCVAGFGLALVGVVSGYFSMLDTNDDHAWKWEKIARRCAFSVMTVVVAYMAIDATFNFKGDARVASSTPAPDPSAPGRVHPRG